jgi:riboflavin synthase
MFTGIVEETGHVLELVEQGGSTRLAVRAVRVLDSLTAGGSIAVNGCCLTAVHVRPGGFACDLTAETLSRTAFRERLRPGSLVNLERPLRADGRFDGHIVQGHVDGVGRIVDLRPEGGGAVLEVEPPSELSRYLVEKGSVAVDGISLTVASCAEPTFTVAVIPYTLAHTSLAEARPGDRVNLEVDILAKYVERLLRQR